MLKTNGTETRKGCDVLYGAGKPVVVLEQQQEGGGDGKYVAALCFGTSCSASPSVYHDWTRQNTGVPADQPPIRRRLNR